MTTIFPAMFLLIILTAPCHNGLEKEEASWTAGAILVLATPFLAHAYAVL